MDGLRACEYHMQQTGTASIDVCAPSTSSLPPCRQKGPRNVTQGRVNDTGKLWTGIEQHDTSWGSRSTLLPARLPVLLSPPPSSSWRRADGGRQGAPGNAGFLGCFPRRPRQASPPLRARRRPRSPPPTPERASGLMKTYGPPVLCLIGREQALVLACRRGGPTPPRNIIMELLKVGGADRAVLLSDPFLPS